MVTDNKLYKVAITVDGNYVHGKYYDTLTQVYYAEEDGGDGCSYISVKPNQNVIPGTDDTVWKRSSRSGKGEKGDKGDPGETGPAGPAGISDGTYEVTCDSSGELSGTATVSDGTLTMSLNGVMEAAKSVFLGDVIETV